MQRSDVPGGKGLNRRILGLAVPAFGALIAEPLFLLADTVIVGRLGTEPLAGVAPVSYTHLTLPTILLV